MIKHLAMYLTIINFAQYPWRFEFIIMVYSTHVVRK